MPSGDFIVSMSKALSEADEFITSLQEKHTAAHVETEQLRKRNEALVQDLRTLRETAAPLDDLVTTLKQIAVSTKGAKAAALSALAKHNLLPTIPNGLSDVPAKPQ